MTGGDPSNQDTTLPRKARASAVPKELALRVLLSPDESAMHRVRRLPLGSLALGRAASNDGHTMWTIDDPMSSRVHASVAWDAERARFMLHDEGSRNGTQLNGSDIEREVLRAGDVLRVGDTVLSVEELDPRLEAQWRPPEGCLLFGRSVELQRIVKEIARIAPSELSLLIEGETGSGKDVVAREIHRVSARSDAYVAINCAAIVESLVESELFGHKKGAFSGATDDRDGVLLQASGGTLLLDEIGELPQRSQAKLLRVLEDQLVRPVGAQEQIAVDVRFVFATNRDLAAEVDRGRFRADLYARINQLHLELPPLRVRPADLLPIVDGVLGDVRLSADAFEAMARHAWPFNVRELISVVQRARLRVDGDAPIELEHIAGDLGIERQASAAPASIDTLDLPPPDRQPTKAELERLLEHVAGSVADAAKYFGKGRTQLYRWLKKHDIDPARFR